MHAKRCLATVLPLTLLGAPALVAQVSSVSNGAVAPASAQPAAAMLASAFAPAMRQLVRQAKLGPGKIALISGTASMLPLMEQLAIASEEAGAATRISVVTDSLARIRMTRPRAQIETAIQSGIAERQAGDVVVFNFPYVEVSNGFAELDSARQAMLRDANGLWGKAQETGKKWRDVWVSIPLPADTVGTGMRYEDLVRTRAAAMAADADQMLATGTALRMRLFAAKQIRVTAPGGTDLTFALQKGRGMTDLAGDSAGSAYAALTAPAGQLSLIVQPLSANGRIRAPWDYCMKPVHDEAVDVAQGVPKDIKAPGDEECVRKILEPLKLDLLQVGLNPGSDAAVAPHAIANNSFEMYGTGVVSIGFGMNKMVGGDDPGPGLWIIPIPRATVLADGVPVVRDGRSVETSLQARR